MYIEVKILKWLMYKEDLAINNINKEFLFGLFIDLINKNLSLKKPLRIQI